jgi:hypothetical protein
MFSCASRLILTGAVRHSTLPVTPVCPYAEQRQVPMSDLESQFKAAVNKARNAPVDGDFKAEVTRVERQYG